MEVEVGGISARGNSRDFEGREVMEVIIAWILLIVGIASGDALYFIASGVFAIAHNCRYEKR